MQDDTVRQGNSDDGQAPLPSSRETPNSIPLIYEFGPFRLEPAERRLLRGGETVTLTPKAFDTLHLLVRNGGHLVDKDKLIRTLWPDTFVEEGSLSNNIFLLRKALGEDAPYIETVPRKGYRFVGAVRQMPIELPLRLEEPPAAQPEYGKLKRNSFRIPGLIAVGAVILFPVAVTLWHSQPRLPVVGNAIRITNDQKAKTPIHLPVTDGVRLFFVEGAPWTSGSTITQVSAAGGETAYVPTPLQHVLGIFAISPDHSELMVGNGVEAHSDPVTGQSAPGAELWAQPLPSGSPRRVGEIYAFAACWTPDGKHILYADGEAIKIANKDGSAPRELARVPGIVRGLRFSPDGQRVRFYVVSRPERSLSTLWEMDANGKVPHLLLPDWNESPYRCCGNWSPDGKFYYFQAGRGMDQAIWVLPEHTNPLGRADPQPSRLISGPLRFSSPVPVNDGKTLLVMGEEPRVELLRYDTQNRRFDSYFQGISAGPFDFSPDRNWITYVSYPDMTLWRSRLDGRDKTQLTFPPVRAYGPSWSPDGSRIAFTDMRYDHPWRGAIVPSSGGTLQSIPPTSDNEVQADPTWTPDGKTIVFSRSTQTRPDQQEVASLDVESGKVIVIPGSDGYYSPRVSPDGRYILALKRTQTELILFDIRTGRWSSLLKGKSMGLNFWSRDSKYVYFRDLSGSSATLNRVRVADQALEPVLSLKDIPQVPDGTTLWIGLTPDDEPVIIRDRSIKEVYALDLR